MRRLRKQDYLQLSFAAVIVLLALAGWFLSGSRTVAAYLLLAGGFAFMLPHMRYTRNDMAHVGQKLFSIVVIAGLLVPVCIAVVNQAGKAIDILSGQNGGQQFPAFLLTILAFFGLLCFLSRSQLPEWKKATGLLLVMLAIKLVYVYLIQAENVSDFRSMTRLANSLVGEGWRNPDELSSTGRIHLERIVFYLYPLKVLFGKSAWVYEIANVLTVVFASGLSWWLTRRFFSERAATFALAIALFAFEPLQAAEIAGHDIPGSLSLMACLVLYVLTRDSAALRQGILLAIFFGLAIVWLAVQRGIGSVFLALLVVYEAGTFINRRLQTASVDKNTDFRRFLVILVIPAIVYMVFSSLLVEIGVKRAADDVAERRFIAVSAHTESWSNGSYGFKKNNWLHRELAEGEGAGFVLRRYVSDIYHSPAESIGMYVRKAKRLFNTGMHQGFYLSKARIKGWGRLDRQDRKTIRVISSVIGASIFLLLVLTLWSLRKAHFSMLSESGFPLFFLSGFALIMITLAEVQARYLMPIWFIAPIYIGAYLAQEERRSSRQSFMG